MPTVFESTRASFQDRPLGGKTITSNVCRTKMEDC
jgi:hypothetical protein